MQTQRMNQLVGLCLLLGTCLVLMAGTGCKTTHDHFKVYDVKDVEEEFRVRLTDQFARGPKENQVLALTHFANPVAKTPRGERRAKIQNRNAHLTWYRVRQREEEPRRTVRFKNQFGQHSVDITEPRYLLVPAEKTSDPESKFVRTLDHYKCYEVVNVNVVPDLPVVMLEDQFGVQEDVRVEEPVFFCNPVMKRREGEEPRPIQDEENHLAVYQITREPNEQQLSFRDQFQEERLTTSESIWLAVPTEKQAFSPRGDG